MKKKIAAFAAAVLFAALALVGCGQRVPLGLSHALSFGDPTPLVGLLDPDSEIRGVWVATVFNLDFPSSPDLDADSLKAEIDGILDNCADVGLNTVFFQVRPSCDAFYSSDIFPVSRFLSSSGELRLDVLEYLLSQAHRREIFVYAWVNPLRVTVTPGADPVLPSGVTDDMTFEYAGKTYLDAGCPAARDLVLRGVGEIVRKYDVDGVVFDDYFYPYPARDEDGKTIILDGDAGTYEKYGGGASLPDFRRQSVNELVKGCRDTVKAIDPDCSFGVAPAGVWRNSLAAGGAGTVNGFEAYDGIYCDAVAWVRGGYVDFLCPQIYWRFTTAGTPYDVLLDWWNAQLGAGGCDLLVAHAAYMYEEGSWSDPQGEMKAQVEFSRDRMAYRGSVFYRYADLKGDASGIVGELSALYENEIVYLSPSSDGAGITVSSHENYSSSPTGITTLTGHSDPAKPLYLNGSPVGRLKNGDFSATVYVGDGENRYLFDQDGSELLFVLYG